jgi:hypothetical protein
VSIRWDASRFTLAGVEASIGTASPEAATRAAETILALSNTKVPVESTGLLRTGHVDPGRGGDNTTAVLYDSVYAHWIHEHLHFKHPHGGQAKFLEAAMLEGKDRAIKAMADTIEGAL